jgi:hypothetical protein
MRVDRGSILAPGFSAVVDARESTRPTANLLPAFIAGYPAIGINGKSYPVTAAQLLPVFTEFLRTIR